MSALSPVKHRVLLSQVLFRNLTVGTRVRSLQCGVTGTVKELFPADSPVLHQVSIAWDSGTVCKRILLDANDIHLTAAGEPL